MDLPSAIPVCASGYSTRVLCPVHGGCGGKNFCGIRCAADGNSESKSGTGFRFLRRFPLWRSQYLRGSKRFHSGKRRAEKSLPFSLWKNAGLAQIREFSLWKRAQRKVSVFFRYGNGNFRADQSPATLEKEISEHFRRFPLRKMAHLLRYRLQLGHLPNFSRSETQQRGRVFRENASGAATP